MRKLFLLLSFFISSNIFSQADNEIQVYASPTTLPGLTIFELHNNYTFTGNKFLADKKSARWFNSTLEITHGFGKNFEMGFYIFTGIKPGGGFAYLGNHIRPRVTVPEDWKWSFGASLSLEIGVIRRTDTSKYIWEGELRPIIDKTCGDWYFSFNPNIEFAFTGDEKGIGIGPQFKTVYTIQKKIGLGIEYYSDLGEFRNIAPIKMQEHLLGPMIDLYLHPMWEVNGGFLFGLTKNSNQRIFKLLIGRRIKNKGKK